MKAYMFTKDEWAKVSLDILNKSINKAKVGEKSTLVKREFLLLENRPEPTEEEKALNRKYFDIDIDIDPIIF